MLPVRRRGRRELLREPDPVVLAMDCDTRTVKCGLAWMQKRCRFCKAMIESGERYCSPECRLHALGRQDLITKQDADRGWMTLSREVRQPWRKD